MCHFGFRWPVVRNEILCIALLPNSAGICLNLWPSRRLGVSTSVIDAPGSENFRWFVWDSICSFFVTLLRFPQYQCRRFWGTRSTDPSKSQQCHTTRMTRDRCLKVLGVISRAEKLRSIRSSHACAVLNATKEVSETPISYASCQPPSTNFHYQMLGSTFQWLRCLMSARWSYCKKPSESSMSQPALWILPAMRDAKWLWLYFSLFFSDKEDRFCLRWSFELSTFRIIRSSLRRLVCLGLALFLFGCEPQGSCWPCFGMTIFNDKYDD